MARPIFIPNQRTGKTQAHPVMLMSSQRAQPPGSPGDATSQGAYLARCGAAIESHTAQHLAQLHRYTVKIHGVVPEPGHHVVTR